MKIQWTNKQNKFKLLQHKALMEEAASRCWAHITKKQKQFEGIEPELCLTLMGPLQMKRLNEESRGIAQTTDVLSFPMVEFSKGRLKERLTDADLYPLEDGERRGLFLGDIVLCPERAAQQASEYGHSLSRELAFLTIHACLHLLGFDHMTPAEDKQMRQKQRDILAEMGLTLQEEACRVEEEKKGFKSGFISIVGRPNAGKSTLLNCLSGEYLAITSAKAQTTRHNIRFILTDEEAQCIFIDTPGLHKPQHKLGDFMMDGVSQALRDSDLLLLLMNEEKKGLTKYEKALVEAAVAQKKPVILAINKIDLMPKEDLLPIIARLNPEQFQAIVPISALKGDNVDRLLACIKEALPEGPLYYSPEDFTDQSERQLTSELVREKILRFTNQEIPHGTGVIINKFEEEFENEDLVEHGLEEAAYERRQVRIQADVLCERESHKIILIGKGGQMLKRIGSSARRDIERMLGCKVHLELFVKVRPDWRNRAGILKDLGYAQEKSKSRV